MSNKFTRAFASLASPSRRFAGYQKRIGILIPVSGPAAPPKRSPLSFSLLTWRYYHGFKTISTATTLRVARSRIYRRLLRDSHFGPISLNSIIKSDPTSFPHFDYVPLFLLPEGRPIKKYEKNAPRIATMVQRTKAVVNVPVVSLIQPPTKGAKTWPIPKNRVTRPNPAEASCPRPHHPRQLR